MRKLERGRNRALRRIGRVLIEFQLLDRNSKGRRVGFVDVALHQHVAREKFPVEDDPDFLIGRPILGRLENENVGLDPTPCAVPVRLKLHALHGRLFQILQAGSRFAEVNDEAREFEVLLQPGDFYRHDFYRDATRLRQMRIPVPSPCSHARQ